MLKSFASGSPQNEEHWDPQANLYSSCCSTNGHSPARPWEQGAHLQHLHSLLPGAKMPAPREGHPLITLQAFGKVHCLHQLLCNVKGIQSTQLLLPKELHSKQVVTGTTRNGTDSSTKSLLAVQRGNSSAGDSLLWIYHRRDPGTIFTTSQPHNSSLPICCLGNLFSSRAWYFHCLLTFSCKPTV